MSISLTSTGVQFPSGSTQTTKGDPNIVDNAYYGTNYASYTVSNIPSFTKLTALFKVAYASGPSNPSIAVRNTANNVTGTLTGGNSLIYASGSSVNYGCIKASGGTTTNFFSGTTYATFSAAKIELFRITTGSYFYRSSFLNSSSLMTIGTGTVTLSAGDVTEILLSGANGGWSTIFSKVYWE